MIPLNLLNGKPLGLGYGRRQILRGPNGVWIGTFLRIWSPSETNPATGSAGNWLNSLDQSLSLQAFLLAAA
jgi:hypothetical protein